MSRVTDVSSSCGSESSTCAKLADAVVYRGGNTDTDMVAHAATHVATRVREAIGQSGNAIATPGAVMAAEVSRYANALTGATEKGGILDRSSLQEEMLGALFWDSCFKIHGPLFLGLVLVLFGSRITKLVHGVSGTIGCLFLTSLLFRGAAHNEDDINRRVQPRRTYLPSD